MEIISNFLERFKKLGQPDEELKKKISSAIFQITNISLEPTQIKYRNGTIFINADSITKSETYLHKQEILTSLQKQISSPRILDFR